MSLRDSKRIYIDGVECGEPIHTLKALGNTNAYGGGAAGADGDENLLIVDGQQLEYHCIAISTLIGFNKVATGLRFPVDNTDNDGIELGTGILAQHKGAFTIGTDPAFHIAFRFTASAVTDYEILGCGFRNVGAYLKHQSGVFLAGLTDFAFIGSYGDANNDGSIYTVTELNDGGMTATDTTNNWAAATPCELRVNVSAAGVVTFQRDLAANATPSTAPTLVAPTTTQTFTFDDGDVVVPFVVALKGAANAVTLDLVKLEIDFD